MGKKTYHGSCHCKAVAFEAEIDLSEGTGKCNCTLCWKRRAWSASAAPEGFKLISGAELLSNGEHGGFCTKCGILAFGYLPQSEWNEHARYSVNLPALDDLEPTDLIAAPITYYDGRNDNWWHIPAETRHL